MKEDLPKEGLVDCGVCSVRPRELAILRLKQLAQRDFYTSL